MKTALITGVTGQDGSYLAEYLLERGYRVFGLINGQPPSRGAALNRIAPDVEVIGGDLLDQGSLISAINRCQPDEVYNLAAISFVPMSWEQPELTTEVTGLGVLRVLEAVRAIGGGSGVDGGNSIRVYQASSSEMFGKVRETPQSETTPFYPRSPYGVAKVYGHHLIVNYRESYGMYAVSGILFNHESPRRGEEFVTRKVSQAVARIKLGTQDRLVLGALGSRRDWGFAGEYVQVMHRMMQQDRPSDYVIGTGISHSVEDLVETAFSYVDLNWRDYTETDDRLMRPAEVEQLVANPARAKRELGWTAEVSFEQLVQMMVEHDLQAESAD